MMLFSLKQKILVDVTHEVQILLQFNRGIPCVLPSVFWVH